MKNKHILIIGGAGFIGSSLCSKLLKYNNKIVVLDNLLSGKLINIPNDITFIKNSAAKIVVMLGAGDIGMMVEDVKNQLITLEKV